MRTKMAPFPTMKPRVCENPECKPKAEGGKHRKDCTLGSAGAPNEFAPHTPWQRTCCPSCRNRLNYLEVRRPKMDAELASRGGPKKRGPKPKGPTQDQTPPTEESGKSSF